MTTEDRLIKKSYYQTILDETSKEHPIKALGRMYMEEMQEEQPELSAIRFAQGEVYFLNDDFEAAIYKWQHPLDKQFIPWAQKNIADAHMELGLLDYAEKYYKEVDTDSLPLQSEVLLQLFSLYIQQGNQERAVAAIKDAVALNPDYSDVTEIARRYFEDIGAWDHALELAVHEAIRTESYFWFDCLEGYAGREFLPSVDPHYFREVLVALYYKDKARFERLAGALWESYRGSDFYFQWLVEINQLLQNHQSDQPYTWKKLPDLFEGAYRYLISGSFLIKDISGLIQDHLTNWLAVSAGEDSFVSSTAVLAWNDHFPAELAAAVVEDAEGQVQQAPADEEKAKEEGLALLEDLKKWAKKEGLLDELTAFMKPKLDLQMTEPDHPEAIRSFIAEALAFLVSQKTESEHVMVQEMSDNEELLIELRDYQLQLNDMEKVKSEDLTSAFADLKNKLKERVQTKLPEVLRGSAALVKEDADFSKLPATLNEEMNKRIAQFLRKDALPAFKGDFQAWLEDAEEEFQESELNWQEFNEWANEQWKKEKVTLTGDFQVLNDWQRDIDRTSRGLLRPVEVNIFRRNNPSQLLLKGAGRLFGPLAKNKDMLVNRYKDYIEGEDYGEVADRAVRSFIQQLEIFEDSIEWDVSRFFAPAQDELQRLIEDVEAAIEQQNNALHAMRENPEIYRDPLTLFEIKLKQYELKYQA